MYRLKNSDKIESGYDGLLVEGSCLFASRRVPKHAEGTRHKLELNQERRENFPGFVKDEHPELVFEKKSKPSVNNLVATHHCSPCTRAYMSASIYYCVYLQIL
jgi:hypothetical protein